MLRPIAPTVWVTILLMAATEGLSQDAINGIEFAERNRTSEIVLGAYRGGIGVVDFNRDGWPDLAVGDNPNRPKRLFQNVPDSARPGGRNFIDVTAGSGIEDLDGTARESVGVLAADYDNDGDEDLYFVARGAGTFGVLYQNDGTGHFTNVSVAAGVRRPAPNAECASWCDFDLDGDLDLIAFGNQGSPYATLLRNDGNGTFSDATSLLPLISTTAHFYSCTWMDYDGDGWPDCFPLTSAGAAYDLVLHNIDDGQGGRRFENVASQIGFVGLGSAPMGIAQGDFDGDGDLDLGISDAIVGTYFRNDSGHFTRITPFATMFGWGVDWIDVDNDRLLDFFTAGSWGTARLDNLQRNLGGGAFANYSPALNTTALATQFSAQVDFNNDGRQDIIAVNPNVSVSVYENVSTTSNHWLRVTLRGDGVRANRDAVGALVRVTAGGVTQLRPLLSGSSTTATEDMRLHFGLGDATVVDRIEVLWPRAGSIQSRTERFLGPISADQALTLAPADSVLAGDLNCDGALTADDVPAFITALLDPAFYSASFSQCNISNADLNTDGRVDGRDIQDLLTGLALQ